MDGKIDGWIKEGRDYESMESLIDGCINIDRCMHGWKKVWSRNGWMKVWMHACRKIGIYGLMNAWMQT